MKVYGLWAVYKGPYKSHVIAIESLSIGAGCSPKSRSQSGYGAQN